MYCRLFIDCKKAMKRKEEAENLKKPLEDEKIENAEKHDEKNDA